MTLQRSSPHLEDDPLWYKDAIIYEVHVRSFFDADGDGIGDFKGLTQKLGYLEDLGVTAIWVLPFYPSPGKDDGYDISDYKSVNPAYGTLRDFQVFLKEAHRRGLRVITELVLNHTSDQHPWFERSRRAPAGSKWRDFYVWSDSPDRYADARIIFKDFEHSNWSWDSIAGAHYWHRFYAHQPDLNFENPAVRKAMLEIVDFWFGMGVDGMRLDAVPYLYEREGTSCENLPETHGYLEELRAHIDARFSNRMLLAEANQWPEDAVAYFGDGDECHMAYHFPLMPRLFMATRMEDRFPIVEILDQTPPIPESCQWAIFLRNHDELTLEMVTDEERDYMNRVYAQDPAMRINLGIRRRFAPLMENNRRKMELLNALLFSLPGTPVIYYGDEIGMGDNVFLGDRNGVRTPMQWSADRNAGFSRANPQRLHAPVIIDPEYHYEAVNVETQHNNPHWLLWWMKRLMELRKRHKAFSRGTLELLQPENRKVLAYLRRHENQTILVVANLSRFVQPLELDLSEFRGAVPVELFGRSAFPPVGDGRYFLSLGPHTFYWFDLQPQVLTATALPTHAEQLPVIRAGESWTSVLAGRSRQALGASITNYVKSQRWFGGKARSVRAVSLADVIPCKRGREVVASAYIGILRVDYFQGESEQYVLPFTTVSGDRVEQVLRDYPRAAIARIRTQSEDSDHLLIDALWDESFAEMLLHLIVRRRSARGEAGELRASATRFLRALRGPASEVLTPTVMRGEQSNTSIVFGDRLILKIFRRLDRGTNPELEIGRVLAERPLTARIPATAGALEYHAGGGEPATLGILQEFIPNGVDGWSYTTDELGRYYERVLSAPPEIEIPQRGRHLLDLVDMEPPPAVGDLIGPYLESARVLGVRTAELHAAFASVSHQAFTPEPYTPFQQRAMFQGMLSSARQTFRLLRDRQRLLPEGAVQERAEQLLALEDDVAAKFGGLIEGRITGRRIRTHGDYHLGQVLYTGKDFVIIDFEGEPSRPLGERRLKRSALRDVAGMLRSFHYAAFSPLMQGEVPGARSRDATQSELGARLWYDWVGAEYLRAYLKTAEGAQFLPDSRRELKVLLDVHLLEKAIYELGYELNNRPEWIEIPLRGVLELMGSPRKD